MAAETIRELVVKYGIDADTDALEHFDQAIESLKGGLLGIGSILVGAGGAILGTAVSAAHAGDQVLKMSQRVGIGVEALQALMFQAKLADVETETLSQSLNILNKNLIEAKNGSKEMTKAFLSVGISAQEIRSGTVTADKAIAAIAKKFEKLPNGPQKTAEAMQFFGRAGAQLIPFLNEFSTGLTETQKAVLQMNMVTEEQARLGQEFNDSMTVMQSALAGIAKQVGMSLLPTIKDLVEEFTAFIVANRDLIKQNITDFIGGLSSAVKMAAKFVFILGNSMAAFARTVGGVGNVVKLLLGALTAISAASILFGIGKLVTGVWALAGAFTAANAAAFLIPTAIGAAILLVILIIDDLIAFFQGRGSVTQVIIDKFGEVIDWFKANFPNLAAVVGGVVDLIKAYVNVLIAFWTGYFRLMIRIGSWFYEVFKPVLDTVFGMVSKITSGILTALQFAGSLASKVGGVVFGQVGSGLQNAAGSLNNVASMMTPSSPLVGGGGGNVSVSAPIQINVPPGTDPTQVGPYVERGLQGSLEPELRAARRASIAGVSY